MLFSPVHAHSANIYFGILAAPGLWQEQNRGQWELLALILDIREVWDGEGSHRRVPSHFSCRWCKSWGVTALVQHFSYQCSACSLPRGDIYRTEVSRVSKFPFFSKLPPERETSSQLRVSLSQWDLSVSCAVVAVHRGLVSIEEREFPSLPALLESCSLQQDNLLIYFWIVYLKVLWKGFSVPWKNPLSHHFPSLLPPLQVPGSALQTWLASAGKWDLPQHPGSGVRNSPVCWGRSAYSTL